jgi:membrane protease YdiL (CAAX protease family)
LAAGAGAAIVLTAVLAANFTVNAIPLAVRWQVLPGTSAGPRTPEADSFALATWLFTLHATIIGLVLMLAGWFGGRRWAVLGLAPPLPSAGTLCAAFALMMLVLLPYNAVVMTLARETVEQDLKPFMGLLRSDAGWLFAILIGIGAPLSEELLFRGFLLGALSKTSLGFFGATLVTTLAWTALHAGYSGFGLVEVFAAGLFFCWVLWRTGSLWPPLFCHTLYNSSIIAILWTAPLPG